MNDCRLAYWFKVDPTGWGATKKAAWLANLSQLQAEDKLEFSDLSNLGYKEIGSLVQHATGDRNLARQVAMKVYQARMEESALSRVE